jgi:hypothetical protein
MATYLIIRDGQIRLRIESASIVGGKVAAPTANGRGYVVDGELARADGVIDEVTRLAKAMRYSQIDPKYLAGPGTSPSGLRAVEESEWQAEQAAAWAAQLWGRELEFARDNRPVIAHDERDEVQGEIEIAGCRWRVTGYGSSFARGEHRVRYAYVDFVGVANDRTAYEQLTQILAAEEARYSRAFARMMEDENNDGCNPPRGVPDLLRTIIAAVDPATAGRIDLERRVRRQAQKDPSGKLGYLMRLAGGRAQALLAAGADEAAIEAALESYQQDPDYADAAWGD